MLLDTVGHYYTYQETGGYQNSMSPPASPYYSPAPSPFTENYFSFPSAVQDQTQWNYNYMVQSPLLSATASDIPDTVRFELGGYGPEAFGHDLGYSQPGSMYNSNFQVQQWSDSSQELNFSHTQDSNDSAYVTNEDSNEDREEEDVDVADDEDGDKMLSGTQCQWLDCSEEFLDQSQLVAHINAHHVQNRRGSEEYPCYWKNCPRNSKPFNAKYKLVTHLRVHTGERPFKCRQPSCGRSFARLENLKIHKRSHTGEKPFPCKYRNECQKSFSNSSDRAKHEQTHKDPKPYKCDVSGCTKRYTDPSSLRKHIKNHSKEEQEQVRLLKESLKGRRGGQSLAMHSQDSWMVEQEMVNSTCTTGNINLMCGGGLVSCDWSRRVEEERYSQYYNSPLYLEV